MAERRSKTNASVMKDIPGADPKGKKWKKTDKWKDPCFH